MYSCALKVLRFPHDRVVLLEIGGNDLLSGTSSIDFERSLGLLLERLSALSRTVVMLGDENVAIEIDAFHFFFARSRTTSGLFTVFTALK
jgi:hypothetical protein